MPTVLYEGRPRAAFFFTVYDFAMQAARAGFEAPVPIDVVRAHFTARLTEADTRAPLLTGGVSFARMVPMRLLPCRVICLLGMNDGDFPRRAAAQMEALAIDAALLAALPTDASTLHRLLGTIPDVPRTDSRELSRELFYTGLTRARSVLHVAGSADVIASALGRHAGRVSGLGWRLGA